MIVLDTNIVSEFTKLRPDPKVLSWYRQCDLSAVYLCGPVVMEQAYGAERFLHKTGSNRFGNALRRLLLEEFPDKVLDFVDTAPQLAGVMRARRENVGRPLSISDSMIAAICLAHGATLATRNVRDFDGLDLKLVNPFEAAA